MTTSNATPKNDWRIARRDHLEDLVDEYAKFVMDDLDKRTIKEAEALIASDGALEPFVQAIERVRNWSHLARLLEDISALQYRPDPDSVQATGWWKARLKWLSVLKAYEEAGVYDRAEAVLRKLQREIP